VNRDARDPSLNEVFQELRQEIHASAAETRQHSEALANDTRQHSEALATDTRRHVDAVTAEHQERLQAALAETRQHSEALATDTRRHFDVVAEGMLSKVQLVAEGLVALDEKVGRFHDEIRREFKKVDRRLLRLEAR
jgi:hypothetical protein